MGIKNIKLSQAGLSGVTPNMVYLETDDTIDIVTATGYLNGIYREGFALNDRLMACVSYLDQDDRSNRLEWLQVKKVGDDWSLIQLEHVSTEFPVLIGPDQEYTTVKAAYDDGVRNMYIIEDVTETAPIVLTENVTIEVGNNVIWDLLDNALDANSVAQLYITIKGNARSIILYASGSSQTMVTNMTATTAVKLSDLIIINQSSAVNCELTNAGHLFMDNCQIEVPDFQRCGFTLRTTESYANNIKLDGGGALCRDAIIGVTGFLSNISVYGTFSNLNPSIYVDDDCIASNIVRELGNISVWQMEVTGRVTNLDGQTGLILNMGPNGQVSNSVGIDRLDLGDSDFVQVDNVRCQFLSQGAGSQYAQINNLYLNQTSSFLGSGMTITGLRTAADQEVVVIGTNNSFIGCHVGTTLGGTGRFNFLAGAQFNTVDGCITEAVPADTSGSGTNRYATATFNVCNATIDGAPF